MIAFGMDMDFKDARMRKGPELFSAATIPEEGEI